MRTVPIPPEFVWEGAHTQTIGPPPGYEAEIAPVDAVVDWPESIPGQVRLSVRCELEAGDLAKLAAGGHVWISFYGQMVPFSVDVTGPDGR